MAVSVGLVGTGTVGRGFLEILAKHHDDFLRHYHIDLQVTRVCSRRNDVACELGFSNVFTYDFHDILNDTSIDLVVELIGGVDDAFDIIAGALQAGKSVVTANKALMAQRGKELFALAHEHKAELAFEASVGGGIPIIGPMKHALISNEISCVMGIVNGTTNFMLTCMAEQNLSYDQALQIAQQKGYAEADPSADVDGLDAAAKIAILSSIAFNTRITLSDVYAQGIRALTPLDLEAARDMGYCVKLLAIGRRSEAGIEVRVHPTMIPRSHALTSVKGVYNAVYVVGDAVGDLMFYGEGAGSGAAASAVMGDVLECARHIQGNVRSFVGCTCSDTLPIIAMSQLETKYYLRFPVVDSPGVLASMASVFAQHNVSIYSVVQRGKKDKDTVEVVYVTHQAREQDIMAVVEEVAALPDCLRGTPALIRVED